MAHHFEVRLDFLWRQPQRLGEFRHAVILQQRQMIPHERLYRRARQTRAAQLQQQALLQVPCADADRVERLDVLQCLFDDGHRPGAEAGDFADRRHQHAIVIDVADDGFANVANQWVGGLQAQLPLQVIGQRAPIGQRIFNRRQFAYFIRLLGPIPVVQVVAEKILVVGIIPGVAFFIGLIGNRLGFGGHFRRGNIFGRFLEERVLDHLLVQQLRELDRRHRQQLDRLLERWRQNQLLGEPRGEFL